MCRLMFIVLFWPLVFGYNVLESNLLVQTKSGPVQGISVESQTKKMGRAFLGVPYAEPPIGKLRFKPPVPASPWTAVFDATRTPLPCYQTYTKMFLEYHRTLKTEILRPWSEDCLTLNVWTPEVVPDDSPIILFIHDGGFLTGTGAFPYYDLSTYSVENQAVAVSVNFRLGAFGFLSLGTTDVAGNLGLMDQQLALRWIHENGFAFGGQPSAIFLFGTGSGAASVGHQIILDRNAGLFKTGILLTGAPTCSWAWQTKEKAVKLGRSVAQSLGCHNDSTDAQLDCLQKVHPEDIVNASILESRHQTTLFRPNIDGTFIKEPPTEAMQKGRLNNVTVIVGYGVSDGALFFHNAIKDLLSENEGLTSEGFDESVKRFGLLQTKTDIEIVRNWYLRNSYLMNTTVIHDQTAKAFSDVLGVCCTINFLDYATESGSQTYKIVFRLPDLRFPSWLSSHNMAVQSIQNADTLKPEKIYGRKLMDATLDLTTIGEIFFRKTAQEFQEFVPRYNLKDRPYLDWGFTKRHLKHHRTEACKLWNDILPK